MKPILQSIQKTIIEDLQKELMFKAVSFIPETFDALETTHKAASLKPLQLYLSTPFPVETVSNISELCWEKLSLQCTLIRKHLSDEKGSFLDLAEQLCYFISHKKFEQDQWEGCFILEPKNPWRWLDVVNGLALQMHFISSQFALIF